MTLETFKQKASGLLSGEDRGVSPVIGVILMVAITVILAAVIGAFVLGLGDGVQSAPSAQLSVNEADDDGEIELRHSGGDSLDTDDLTIYLDGSEQSGVSWDDGSVDSISTGDRVAVSGLDASEDTVDFEILHNPSDQIMFSSSATTGGGSTSG